MKKIFLNILVLMGMMSVSSCSFFEMDNMPGPKETLLGKVVDIKTGKPVLTDQCEEGIRVRLIETSWEGNPTPFDFYCRPDGTFRNTKIFKADYNIKVDGPFIPIVRKDEDGNVLEDLSQNVKIKGTTEVTFKVQPFLNVEFIEAPTAKNGVISAKFKVTRGVSPEEFQEKVEPMGEYDDEFINVTDVQLFVSYSPSVGYRERDERWSNSYDYEGADFEEFMGKTIEIESNGKIKSGQKVFVRAAARINFDTPRGSGIRRWNFSEPMEVNIP